MPRKTYVDVFIEQCAASDGQTFIRLRSGRNGQILMTSETYKRPASMRKTCRLLSRLLNSGCYAEVRDLTKGKAAKR